MKYRENDRFRRYKGYENPEGCHKICHVGGRTYDIFGEKELREIADGTEKCPTEPTEKKKWILKDYKVKNYVLRTVDKKVKKHIIHCVHGNDMFLKLQTLYK